MDESNLEKSFREFFEGECCPVGKDEERRPTRVVWKAKGGLLSSRVFPNQDRAYNFAANLQEEVVKIQDAKEAPPEQQNHPNRMFLNRRKFGSKVKK